MYTHRYLSKRTWKVANERITSAAWRKEENDGAAYA